MEKEGTFMCEIYLIFLSGFALLGLYCFIDTLISVITMSKYPPTVTIFLNSQDTDTMNKIRYIENNLPNNYNIFYPFDNKMSENEQQKALMNYLGNVLNVNKK